MYKSYSTELRRAVFLDRDGTLNVDRGYTHRIEQLQLIDGVVEGLQQIQAMGYVLVIVTNQSGIGRGFYTTQQMQQFNKALCDELARHDVQIQQVYFCSMHPKATIPEHQGVSPRRKPEPGMLMEAASEFAIDLSQSIMVGDKYDDVSAGHRAGCRSILIARDGALPKASDQKDATPDAVAHDLVEAAKIIAGWQSGQISGQRTSSES